jgi:hypothetical protein
MGIFEGFRQQAGDQRLRFGERVILGDVAGLVAIHEGQAGLILHGDGLDDDPLQQAPDFSRKIRGLRFFNLAVKERFESSSPQASTPPIQRLSNDCSWPRAACGEPYAALKPPVGRFLFINKVTILGRSWQ